MYTYIVVIQPEPFSLRQVSRVTYTSNVCMAAKLWGCGSWIVRCHSVGVPKPRLSVWQQSARQVHRSTSARLTASIRSGA